jgi:hypothetical protein
MDSSLVPPMSREESKKEHPRQANDSLSLSASPTNLSGTISSAVVSAVLN